MLAFYLLNLGYALTLESKTTMKTWEILSEEASIVLVGNMNPKIFHPEWFIRKGIVGEWDYKNEQDINLPDMAQVVLPADRNITVFLNKFSITTSRSSEYLTLKDLVVSTFTLLSETPVLQLGMNFTSVIKINNLENWIKLGRELAPQSYWKNSASYINDLGDEKQSELGLWHISMNMPRPDNQSGFLRPEMVILPHAGPRVLAFSINNHIEVKDSSALTMTSILEESWDTSLALAKEITSNIMDSLIPGE